jgi:SecY interacting protein Syd
VNKEVDTALAGLFQDALEKSGKDSFTTRFDPSFRSDCEISQQGENTLWRPCAQSTAVDFSGLANAVESPIHPDICAYYSAYWAGTLEARSQEGPVSLIQLWNHEDFDRLIANLIGHFMAKQRIKCPFTVFFANTDPDSEFFLSIDNESGQVLLEEPAKAPLRVVEQDLATFLSRLTPVNKETGIY